MINFMFNIVATTTNMSKNIDYHYEHVLGQ